MLLQVSTILEYTPDEIVMSSTIKTVESQLDKILVNQEIYDFKKCIKILHKNDTPYTNNKMEPEANIVTIKILT